MTMESFLSARLSDAQAEILARHRSELDTPHDHEGPDNKPLWLIWRTAETDFPILDSVSDSLPSAEYHVIAAYQSHHRGIHVERIPANHRFASSLGNWQVEAHNALWKARHRKELRTGD